MSTETSDAPQSPPSPRETGAPTPPEGGDAVARLKQLAERYRVERDQAQAQAQAADATGTADAPTPSPTSSAAPPVIVSGAGASATAATATEVATASEQKARSWWRRKPKPEATPAGWRPTAATTAQEVPAPPKSRRRSKTARNPMLIFFNGLFTFLLVGALIALLYMVNSRSAFEAPGPLAQAKAVLVPPGAALGVISSTLERAGVVESANVFEMGVQMAGTARQLKAGEFEFAARASPREVMETLIRGKSIEYSITFPEGWSSEQIVAKLNQDQVLTGRITSVPLEGTLLPDTYRFTRGMTREQMIDTMRRAQERLLTEVWSKRQPGLPINSPRDLVILASIVEKETGQADERRTVAGVFVNRLRRGMRLESDPTILYGLYQGRAWMEARTIRRSEMDAPNAYNTYKINGLPPGPIANPGRAAMEAVANPEATNYVFFVADGTGGHAFAETLEQHNRNVQRWRQIEQQRSQARPNPTPSIGVIPAPTQPAQPLQPVQPVR